MLSSIKSEAAQPEPEHRSIKSSQENCENYLNCDINTYEESLTYAKKVIAMAISNVAYLRALWPENFFVTRHFENLELKIVNSKSHPNARVLTDWIVGIFHALERKYLRQFTFSIHLDPKNPNDVIETYEFNLAYSDKVNLEIASIRERKEKIRPNSIQFIRNLMYATNMLKELPNKGYLNLRLTYYEDVTPADYEPPGFRAGDELTELNFAQGGGRIELPVGRLNSLWHVIDFSMNACKYFMRDYDDYEKAGESVAQERTGSSTGADNSKWIKVNVKKARRLSRRGNDDKSIETDQSSIDDSFNMPTGPNVVLQSAAVATELKTVNEEEEEEEETEPSSLFKNDIDETVLLKHINESCSKTKAKVRILSPPPRIKCDCGLNQDNANMDLIKCVSCNKTQHAVCYRILMTDNDSDAARAWLAQYNHVCRTCFRQMTEESRPSQTDKSIYSADEEYDMCVLRRVTYWIWQFSKYNNRNNEIAFTPQSIAHDIGLNVQLVCNNLSCIATKIKMTKMKSFDGDNVVYRIDASDLAKLVADWFTQPLLNKTPSQDNSSDTSIFIASTPIGQGRKSSKACIVRDVNDEMSTIGKETKKMKITDIEAKVRTYKKASMTPVVARLL